MTDVLQEVYMKVYTEVSKAGPNRVLTTRPEQEFEKEVVV